MTDRFYLTPIVGTGKPGLDPRRPKYVCDLTGIRWGAYDYGVLPVMLLAADVERPQHGYLMQHSDILVAPLDLDQKIFSPALLSRLQDHLWSLRIPAFWLTVDYTVRQWLRVIAGCFQLGQIAQGRDERPAIRSSQALLTPFRALPKREQEEIEALCFWADLKIQQTVRPIWELFRAFVDSWWMETFYIGGFAL